MREIVRRRKSCRLCGGADHELILRLAPSAIADAYVLPEAAGRPQEAYPLDLFQCRACGASQILDVIDPSVLYRDYIYVTTSSMGLSDHFRGYAADVHRALGFAPGSLAVDIGSNDGTLLGHFKALGMRVLGVEPASAIAGAATSRGITTLPEFFDPALAARIRREHGPASLVTMNNLFANIDDLDAVAEGVMALLGPGGVFVIETFYFADFVANLVFDFMYHEHLSYFTVTPLSRFFERHGMRVLDVERIPTKGGSIRLVVGRAADGAKPSSRVADLMAEEKASGILGNGPLLEGFRARIERARTALRGRLDRARAEGLVMAGYGASATSTTLIHHFGLQEYLDFLVDDNPAKQGTLSPGLHLPVLPGEALADRRPGAIVILAWRYWEPIARKIRALPGGGGVLLVPLPELREISAPPA